MIEYRKYSKIVIPIFLLLGFTSFLSAQTVNDGSRYAANSVLANGKWIQLKVKETGIYKLTYDDIKRQGISDPSKVKIYGYGGWILPEDFTQPYVDDLPEVSVYINKGNDGVFSSGDYLLFYGRGTTKWTYNQVSDVYVHENNPYSTYGSYFMTESDTGPKEIDTIPLSSNLSNPVQLNIFDDYAVHEKDSISILNSGRELYGENFIVNGGTQSFTFTIQGITSNPGKVRLYFVAAPQVATPVKLSIGGQDIINMPVKAPGDTYTKASVADSWGNWNGTENERVTATISYNPAAQSVAYLNFIVLNMKRTLQFYPVGYTFFRSSQSLSNVVTYSVGNSSASCQIWDVTQNNNIHLMETVLQNGQMQFTTAASNTLREYAMVDFSKTFPTPEFAGTVANQNLHALPPTNMVIIAPTVYLPQARTLADKHQQKSGLRVAVVEEKTIFNEFSSGTPDVTAYRRFMKMFYDRATSDVDKPKYLLLYGDALFDNRHLTSTGSRRDPKYYLLTYQVRESLNENTSYGTDDYIGFLDDKEGISIASDGLDIGIGRFPVSSLSQATDALNKVTSYMDNKQYGIWKNKLIFAADMQSISNGDSYAVHATQADTISQYISRNYPEYLLYKYYVDAYKVVSVNGKFVAPDAKKDLLNQLNAGCFLLNYTGHGNTTSWSAEDLLNIADVRQMNFKNLPLWITATCDFGWFDGFDTSGGETAFLNKSGGAIALFTTSRVVSSGANANLNSKFIRYMFTKNEGKRLSIGDIFRLSKKLQGTDANKLNYVLLGDPALTLNYPEWTVRLDSVNGNPITDGKTYTWKALDKVTVSGVITDDSGAPVNNFSGTLNANIFDSQQTMQSVTINPDNGKRFTYMDYPNMIYSGNTAVENGAFNLTFNVPLDISYSTSNGKIGLYAYDPTRGIDAAGSFTRYNLSGTGDIEDTTGMGPTVVDMYLNTESFRNGDKVNETPFFYAKVMDENGINLSGSDRGHDMVIIIDNNSKWTYSLNNYYQAIDITQGTVGFSIPELPAGDHTLLFRVWNIFNNSSVDTLNFTVVKGYKPTILDLQATINPDRTFTFNFINNLPGTILNIEIGVYDVTGRTVWIYTEKGSSGLLQQYPIQWNLVSNTGTRVPTGVYIYRATIRTATSTTTTKAKKIIVSGQ